MALFLLLALLSSFHGIGTRANVTDPAEAKAVNTIFMKWGISANWSQHKWNASGDLCSDLDLEGPGGSAENLFNAAGFNPGIICDCRIDDVCHVTRLKAENLNITGGLPMEFRNLTYLNNLNIKKNFFTGPFPAFIGNFSEMQYLSISHNAFSGEIPKELGKLRKLKSLGIGLNNFSGQLPPELGNIRDLEQIYIDSIGVTGRIPLSFANFTKLMHMKVSDNNFTGKLPDFIGNFTSLQSLRFYGNSLEGPIPSRFGNLVNLRELWLSDLLSGSSSLSFIENMANLSQLILRNSKISGVIPSSIDKYTSLAHLDLSFNNLSGQLPQSLFNLPELKGLYLANNSFTGALPVKQSNKLRTIDLSYNNLSGSLPSWTAKDGLQLNLVANNFDSNNDLPWADLTCTQKNFPCYHGSPIYSAFAINCGGDEVMVPDGTTYDADNQNLSKTYYFVNREKRWALVRDGAHFEYPNPQYMWYSSSNIMNISNPELFQSARRSPSSLRYYGLALENGNYTVMLDFAETAFPQVQSWVSLGRRIFDIYIQGNLIAKDFDLRKEAGEGLFVAITRNYTTLVTNNILEIHFFWAGKGSCCIPTKDYFGPSISAISVTPNFIPTVSNHLPVKKNKSLVPGIVAGIAAALLLLLGIFVWRWKRRPITEDAEEAILGGLQVESNCFRLAELKTATDNFNSSNKLGEGGFGSVFKGTLSDGQQVAIKQLSVSSLQGKKQFATEVAVISAVQHRNLVKLYGCCNEGTNRLLVYEHLENKSLNDALFGNSGLHLDWSARFDICLGIARGLAYLHEESSVRIVHRDIKASNILLDANLNPKISDFGLAKLYDDTMTHMSTRVAGTFGYLAPEYAMRGLLTEKADIYGFGIVVLEILSGRPNVGWNQDGRKVYLLGWAWQLHEKYQGLEILDPSLSSFNETEAIRMIQIAFLCTQTNPTLRPAMSRVIAMLVGNVEIGVVCAKPTFLTELNNEDNIPSTGTTHLSTPTTTGGPVSTATDSSVILASTPSDFFLTGGR